MQYFSRQRICVFTLFMLLTACVFAQSTATIQGTVTDASGAVVPNATVTIHSNDTGSDRMLSTDAQGFYSAAGLPVGHYRIEAKSQGMQTTVVSDFLLEVGRTAEQNFTLKVASTS